MSRAGFNRRTGLATVTLALAAELPDADVAISFFSRITGFAEHRGFTHTFLGAPFIAAAAVGIVYAGSRWGSRRGWTPKSPVDWKLLYAGALVAALSHILLDFTNIYGVRPFAPFSYRWYSWDIVNIVEPLVTLPLLLALLASGFFGLIAGEIGGRRARFPGRGWAIAGLVTVALVWWGRDFEHRRAVTLLGQELYEEQEPVRLSANPYAFNPLKWYGVVETSNAFHIVEVDTWRGRVDPKGTAEVLYKPEETPFTLAAKRSRLGKVYLDWAKYPYVEVEIKQPEGTGAIVYMHDLRFPRIEGRRNLLGAEFELDAKANVIWSGFAGQRPSAED